MNIRSPRELCSFAAQRLTQVPEKNRILLIYIGLSIGLSALVTVVTYVLGLQLDNFGGLRHITTRTLISTLQTVLPLVQSIFSLCLSLGFTAAMLRIARGQYVSPNTLRLGFDRFWVLLRCEVIKLLMYLGAAFTAIYLGILLYMISPLSNGVVALLTPYLAELSPLDGGLVLPAEVYAQFNQMIWPAYLICAVLAGVLLVPMVYSYRMAHYVIIDRPALGAMAALRESKQMMRRNRMSLFKLDVSLWWYYLAISAATVLGYGDVILPMLGVELPFNGQASYFIFYAAYLAAIAVIYYFLLCRVDVTYALAYDAVKPQEQQDNGVVLGNIFQM